MTVAMFSLAFVNDKGAMTWTATCDRCGVSLDREAAMPTFVARLDPAMSDLVKRRLEVLRDTCSITRAVILEAEEPRIDTFETVLLEHLQTCVRPA